MIITPASGTTKSISTWLPQLVPGIVRLHRTAIVSVATFYLGFTAIAFTVAHQIGHPRASIVAGQLFNGTMYNVATYAIYLPVLAAIFVGAPMFARPLETGIFRFAWTQGLGRRRIAATTLMIFILELTVLSIPLGVGLNRLWFDLSPQYWNVWTNHVFFTSPWIMAIASVIGLLAGALLGLVFRRVLASLAATSALMIALYLWATMWPIFQETLLWFAKPKPSSYAGVPLRNGNFIAHYDYSSVNLFFTNRSGHTLSMSQFNSQIVPTLTQYQKQTLNGNAANLLHHLGLREWQGTLFHAQFHGFLTMWIGFGVASVIALLVAIFGFIGGNDRLIFGRVRQ